MKLPLTTKIANKKTVRDWDAIRNDLNDFKNITIWTAAFEDFFMERIYERYLTPIDSIKKNGQNSGEGFAIMAIICSIIEFLETTYQGRNYKYNSRGQSQYEYSQSSPIFISFLTTREPFSKIFEVNTANDFYSKVRCGLLHEARTNGKWIISGKQSQTILTQNPSELIIYRNNFHDAIKEFINGYKLELLASNDRKEAFLRKFDNLCLE